MKKYLIITFILFTLFFIDCKTLEIKFINGEKIILERADYRSSNERIIKIIQYGSIVYLFPLYNIIYIKEYQ